MTAYGENPAQVSARELVENPYGVTDRSVGRAECLACAEHCFGRAPEAEDDAELCCMWLNADDGFAVSYEDMTPEADAVACFADSGTVSQYGYVFYFPYVAGRREEANREQSRFCGCLLQELSDSGYLMGSDNVTASPATLFVAYGLSPTVSFTVRLDENVESETEDIMLPPGVIPKDRVGSFRLYLTVVPSPVSVTL